MKKDAIKNYSEVIQVIKNAILKSRYRAAALANKELLSLYYGIGKYISENSREGFWGTSAIETISEKLQQELPGLRGFSAVNIKRMRQFYEAWSPFFAISQISTKKKKHASSGAITNSPLPSDEFKLINIHHFLTIGFSHHYELLIKTTLLEERLFYIE